MMGDFNLPAGSRGVLVRVLHDVVQCAKGGVEYTGDRKAGSGGHNKMITTGSVEEKMVADSNFGDSNFGFKQGSYDEHSPWAVAAAEGPWFHSDVAETRLRLIAASRERHAKKKS